MSKKNDNLVTCSSGVQVRIKPVSVKLLEQFDISHRAPEPPMVEADVIGGGKDLVPNPEDAEYQAVIAAHNRQTGDDFTAMILDMGVELDLPTDDAWKRKLKRIGVCVPEDPDEQRLLWIQTIVMPDFMGDLKQIVAAVLKLSGVNEEAIDSWVALF